MSSTIQNALTSVCDGIKNFVQSVGAWGSRAVTNGTAFVVETTTKVSEFIKPQFEAVRTFAQENKTTLLWSTLALTVGVVVGAIVNNQLFARGTNTPAPETAPAPAPTPAQTV
jgi:hypothetical protein